MTLREAITLARRCDWEEMAPFSFQSVLSASVPGRCSINVYWLTFPFLFLPLKKVASTTSDLHGLHTEQKNHPAEPQPHF